MSNVSFFHCFPRTSWCGRWAADVVGCVEGGSALLNRGVNSFAGINVHSKILMPCISLGLALKISEVNATVAQVTEH